MDPLGADYTIVRLRRDVPVEQRVAVGPGRQAFVLAGEPGSWRVLRVDFGSKRVRRLVELR